MDAQPPLQDKVTTWLETSGRALEMRVAREMYLARADEVEQSFEYVDPETDKLREGDVRARFCWTPKGNPVVGCSLTAVIECKSSAANPWVAMYDSNAPRLMDQLDDWSAYAFSAMAPVLDFARDRWIGRRPFTEPRVAVTAVSALGDDKPNKPNPANEALRQVMSAAAAERAAFLEAPETRTGHQALVLLPVIVTAAPLFTCSLGPDGNPVVELVRSFSVLASGRNITRKRVYVINESELGEFARSLENLRQIAQSYSTLDG